MSVETDFKPGSFGVIGAGPVGCVLAANLAQAGYDVILCDVRPELVKPALDPGIIIEGTQELVQPVAKVCTSVDDLLAENPDVIFITVKANALPLLASALESYPGPNRAVVSWQNGLDTELALAEKLGKDAVLRAVVNYGCSLVQPAKVHLAFHQPPHKIQEISPQSREMAVILADVLTKCDLPTERSDHIVSQVWRKSIMNASMNPVCAITGMTMAQAMNDPIIFQIVDALIKESVNVARANEIFLGWDYYPYCMEYMKQGGDHKPSMLVDIENGRRTEIDFMNGKIVEYGARVGMETPINMTLRALVKALEPK